MANKRDVNKRLVGIGIPIETMRKIERRAKTHNVKPAVELVNILDQGVRDVVLTSEDYIAIAHEVKKNEQKRNSK